MKIIKILITFIIITTNAIAQDSVYNEAIKFMDNAIKTDEYYIDFMQKDSLFLINLIKYINTFKKDSTFYRMERAVDIIANIVWYPDTNYVKMTSKEYHVKRTKSLPIRQQAVNFILDVYNYPTVNYGEENSSNICFFENQDFDSIAKIKIKKLLCTEKNISKINKTRLINLLINSYNNSYYWQKKIKREVLITNKDIKIVKDSLYSVQLTKDIPNFELKPVYNTELLQVIGKNYMYEFIPEIENLMDTAKYFPIELSKLVLARLGIEPYKTNILDSLQSLEFCPSSLHTKYIIMSILLFICDQDRTKEIAKKWINNNLYYVENKGYGDKIFHYATFPAYTIANSLINFNLPIDYSYSDTIKHIQMIKSVKLFLEENPKSKFDSLYYFQLSSFYEMPYFFSQEFQIEYIQELKNSKKFKMPPINKNEK